MTDVTAADMRAFGASEEACYRWPEGSEEHKALRAAFIAGAAAAAPTCVLWCCHERGSDDVYAAPDYETALKWSDMANALNWRGLKGAITPPATYDDCLVRAAPAVWPWTAEAHAENLPKSIADFAIPKDRTENPS